jgi:hypothetical protein
MTTTPEWMSELPLLLARLVDGDFTAEDRIRLNNLLRQGDLPRRYYRGYMELHAIFEWQLSRQNETETVKQWTPIVTNQLPLLDSSRLPIIHVETPSAPTSSGSGLPLPTTFSYLSSGWLASYLVATVILGMGLAAMAIVPMSQPTQVAIHIQRAMEQKRTVVPRADIVGRITGMVDCKLNDSEEVVNGDHVSLGKKYSLASGLMEITYDTGAKVILQGPVTYEVESKNGGFMAVGKLTGKIETPQAKGFAVRTPTALVTDLGTEFGVEVGNDDRTHSHVFQGIVDVQPLAAHGVSGKAMRLTVNESAVVERQAGIASPTIRRVAVNPTSFIRSEQFAKASKGPPQSNRNAAFERWWAYSQQLRRDPSLLAYYDFQQRKGDPTVLPNVAANGDSSRDGRIENARWTNGRIPGKQALVFNGLNDTVRVTIPQTTGDLTLAAWVEFYSMPDRIASGLLMSIHCNTDPQATHWQVGENGHLSLSNGGMLLKSEPSAIGDNELRHWVHLACAYDSKTSSARAFVNGRMIAERTIRSTVPFCVGEAFIGRWDPGSSDSPDIRQFRGCMDELVIVGRALTNDEVRCMYDVGVPKDHP